MFPPRPAAAFKSSMAAARSSSDSSVEQYLGFHGLPWVSKIYMGKYIYICGYILYNIMYVLQYIIYTWVYMEIYIYNIMYICIYIIEYNIIYYNIYICIYIYTIYVYVSIGAPASSSFGQSKSKPCHALHLTIMWNCIYFLKYVEKYMTSSTYGMPYILLLNHQLLYVSLYVVFAFF